MWVLSDDGLLGYISPCRMGKCSLVYHFAFGYRSFHVSFTGWLVDINCLNWQHLLPELLLDFIFAQSGGEVDNGEGNFSLSCVYTGPKNSVGVRCDIIAVSTKFGCLINPNHHMYSFNKVM